MWKKIRPVNFGMEKNIARNRPITLYLDIFYKSIYFNVKVQKKIAHYIVKIFSSQWLNGHPQSPGQIARYLSKLHRLIYWIARAGLTKIEYWLGPHQNWLQSAFSKCIKKGPLAHISTYLFTLYCLFLLCTFNGIFGIKDILLAGSIYGS